MIKRFENLDDEVGNLVDIVDEIFARTVTNHTLHSDMLDVSLEELCDIAMEILERVKVE